MELAKLETRAADPFLSALEAASFPGRIAVTGGTKNYAHAVDKPFRPGFEVARCGWFVGDSGPLRYVGTWMTPGDARWISIPCRECFPEAPPPGTSACTLHDNCFPERPGLEWQVEAVQAKERENWSPSDVHVCISCGQGMVQVDNPMRPEYRHRRGEEIFCPAYMASIGQEPVVEG